MGELTEVNSESYWSVFVKGLMQDIGAQMKADLIGTVALVTGGGRAIGRATAERLGGSRGADSSQLR